MKKILENKKLLFGILGTLAVIAIIIIIIVAILLTLGNKVYNIF